MDVAMKAWGSRVGVGIDGGAGWPFSFVLARRGPSHEGKHWAFLRCVPWLTLIHMSQAPLCSLSRRWWDQGGCRTGVEEVWRACGTQRLGAVDGHWRAPACASPRPKRARPRVLGVWICRRNVDRQAGEGRDRRVSSTGSNASSIKYQAFRTFPLQSAERYEMVATALGVRIQRRPLFSCFCSLSVCVLCFFFPSVAYISGTRGGGAAGGRVSLLGVCGRRQAG